MSAPWHVLATSLTESGASAICTPVSRGVDVEQMNAEALVGYFCAKYLQNG